MTTARDIIEEKYEELEKLVVSYIDQAQTKREATILAAKASEILEAAKTIRETRESFEALISQVRAS